MNVTIILSKKIIFAGTASMLSLLLGLQSTAFAAVTTVPDQAWQGAPSVTGGSCENSHGDSDEIPVGCRQVAANLVKSGWVYNGGAISNVLSGNRATSYTQFKNLFRYNPVSGAVDTSFAPQFYTNPAVTESGMIRSIASGAGNSIYVAGDFKKVKNTPSGTEKAIKAIAKIDTATGKVDTAFKPNIGCAGASASPCTIYSVKYIPSLNIVLLGGKIVRVNGVVASGFAALDGTTGATIPNAALNLAKPLRGSITYVRAIAVSPVNDREFFVAGEFSELGVNRPFQAIRYGMTKLAFDGNRVLSGLSWNSIPALSASRPTTYPASGSLLAGKCSSNRSWARQLVYNSNGTQISIASSAGGLGDAYPALCDAFATFKAGPEANGVYNQSIYPTLYNRTPVDTVLSMCYLNNVAYIGGHFRAFNHVVYQNNVRTYYIPFYLSYFDTNPANDPPLISVEQPNAHFGLVAINANSADGTSYGKAITLWNNTQLELASGTPHNAYFPWDGTAATTTGRGNGWGAASCTPASQSPTGKDLVIFGGDARGVRGDFTREKIAQFNGL